MVLWDFDGTLAETLGVALRVYNALAEKHGLSPVRDPEAVRDMTMAEFLKTHRVSRLRVPFLFAAFLREVRARREEIRISPNVAETVRRLQQAGVSQGIVSSNSTETILSCLDRHHLLSCFQHVQGTSRLQGKSVAIRRCVSRLGVELSRVAYVGDEVRDVEAARAAGVRVISVTWGLNSAAALREAKPDGIAETTEILETLLDSAFSRSKDVL